MRGDGLLLKIVLTVVLALCFEAGCKATGDDDNETDTDQPASVTYQLTFDKNAQDATGTMAALTVTPGTAVTLTANAFGRNGWNFQGWAATAAGDAVYADQASYTPAAANATLYAKWKTWTKLAGSTIDSENIVIALDSGDNSYIAGITKSSLDDQTLSGTKDAFVIKYNAQGVRQWTRLVGTNPSSTLGVTGIAVDPSGNCCISGYTDAAFDDQSKTGTRDMFLVKYDAAGTRQWSRMLGVASFITYAQGVSSDASGNWYAAGNTTGALDGQTLSPAYSGLFITKYSAAGGRQWTRILASTVGSFETHGAAIATDSSGNSIVAGKTDCSVDSQTQSGAAWDVLVAKYDTSGTLQWTRLLGCGNPSYQSWSNRIALDSSGSSYVTGWTDAGIGGQTLSGTRDAFVIKYDSSGTLQWTRLLGVSGVNTWGYGIAVDSSGSSYAAGETFGDLDGKTLTCYADAYVVKFDATGTKAWTKLLGVTDPNAEATAFAVALDASGDCYVSGGFVGAALNSTFAGEALIKANDAFVTTVFNN